MTELERAKEKLDRLPGPECGTCGNADYEIIDLGLETTKPASRGFFPGLVAVCKNCGRTTLYHLPTLLGDQE